MNVTAAHALSAPGSANRIAPSSGMMNSTAHSAVSGSNV
jgi:hypothetical protein